MHSADILVVNHTEKEQFTPFARGINWGISKWRAKSKNIRNSHFTNNVQLSQGNAGCDSMKFMVENKFICGKNKSDLG